MEKLKTEKHIKFCMECPHFDCELGECGFYAGRKSIAWKDLNVHKKPEWCSVVNVVTYEEVH